MFTNKKLIIICDINTVTDPETLDKQKVVANGVQVMGSVDLVGVQTQQLAQIQNMNFNYSIVIDRMYYDQQKYLYFENHLYEIKNVGKAKLPKDCTLNVQALKDANIQTAIEEWKNANLPS